MELIYFYSVLDQHSLEVRAGKDDMDFKYEISLLKTKIDSCRVSEGVMNSIFMKIMMENFSNSSDYDFKWVYVLVSSSKLKLVGLYFRCPFKAGTHKMINMRVTTNFLPPFPRVMFPSGRVAFYVKDDIYGKVNAKQKKMVRLYTWELFGKVYDDNMITG